MAAPPSTSVRAITLEFIEKYRNSECLWKVTDENYKNRHFRRKCLEDLLSILKKNDTTANLDSVTKKINSLRSAYNKEHNKVKKSIESGEGEIHVPKLWYYNEMLFLAGLDVPRNSSSVNSILDDMPFEDNAEVYEVTYDESEDTVSTNAQSPLSQVSVASSSRHEPRKTKAQADIVLAKIAKRMDETNAPSAKLQYDSFGNHIAERLRALPHTMAIYCQKIINDAIFMAETNNLTIDSHIVNNYPQVYFSQQNLNRRSSNRLGHSQTTKNDSDMEGSL